MRKLLKPVLLFAAVLVALVGLVLVGAAWWIQSGDGLRWVERRVNDLIPGTIAIDSHRLSLLEPGLDLYDVVLRDSRQTPLAGLAHVSIRLDWVALWRKEIRLRHLRLQAPWADLAVDEDGELNLTSALVAPDTEKEPQPAKPEGGGLPVNLVFESIRLTDGRMTVEFSGGTTRLAVDGIDLSAEADLSARSGGLALALKEVRYGSTAIHPEPARIGLKASLEGDKLEISTLNAVSGRTTLKLSGSADQLWTDPRVKGELSVDTLLADWKRLLALDGEYEGHAAATLTLDGALANPDATLNLKLDRGQIAGFPLDRGGLSARLQDRLATVDEAVVHLADGALRLDGSANLRRAFPEGFLSGPTDLNAIVYDLNLVQDIPDLGPWTKPFMAMGGNVTGRVSITGAGVTLPRLSARLDLDGMGRNLVAPGMDRPMDADLGLSAQLDGGRVRLSRLNASADGLEVSGTGHFQLDGRVLAADLKVAARDLSPVLAVAGMPSIQGALDATMSIDGSLNQPQFSLNLISTGLQSDAYVIGDLTVDANLTPDGLLNLHTLDLHNRGSRISGSGRLRLLAGGGGIDPEFVNTIDLTWKGLSAADFIEDAPLRGSLNGGLRLNGPLKSPKGRLTLDGKNLRVDAVTIGDIDAGLQLKEGVLFLDQLHLRNGDSRLGATGHAQLLEPGASSLAANPTFDLSVESDHIDPNDFIDAVSGDFTLDATLSGRVDNPAGRIRLTGRQVTLAAQAIESISLDARVSERRLWLDRLLTTLAPSQEILARGWVGLDRTADLTVTSDGISISRIDRLDGYFPGDGTLRFNVAAQGRLENPDIDGRLTVSDITVNDEPIQDIDLTFSLHDMLAKAAGRLNFEVDAACDLKEGDFDARLIFDRTQTAAYFSALGKEGLHGTLTGRVEAAGSIRDAANTSARVNLDAVHLRFKETPLIDSEGIHMQLANGKLSIPGFEMSLLSTGKFHIQGEADLHGPLNIQADGRIPVAAAAVFSDALTDADGSLALAGSLGGDAAAPQIDARIDLQAIALRLPGLDQNLHDLNGSILITQEAIRIDAVSGFLDTGSFSLDGTVAHESFTPVDLDLSATARSLPIAVPETLSVLLNSDIRITGSERSAQAAGEIVVLEGIYYKDVKINLLEMASTRKRAATAQSRPMEIPYFDTVDLDIGVTHRQPLLVENNLAQLQISPDLKITGTLSRPVINGRAEVREGTVIFQKKTFDVKRGIIDFVDPYKTQAEIDIESRTTIREWTITLTIKGSLDNLDLRLSSVPSETDSDILSLILFGQTARELAGGNGDTQRSTGQIMAEMIADTFGRDIKKSTGVDILEVEANGGDDEESEGIRVTVGKHLSDRMTVKYAVETKDGEIVQRAISEYKLLENLLVSGFQGTDGVYGSELVFRIEFR